MTLREDRDRQKSSREELGKFFYRLAEISFTTLVVGGTISLFTNTMGLDSYCIVVSMGIALTIFFAMLGNRVLKNK